MPSAARLFLAVLVLAWPGAATAFGQDSKSSVQVSGGPHLNTPGWNVAASYGFTPFPQLTFLVSVERSEIPTKVTHFPDGFSTTRGETLTFVTAELRAEILRTGRILPYVRGGAGRGVSHADVSDLFPNARNGHVAAIVAGGGARVPMGRRLSAFVDTGFALMLHLDSSDGDIMPVWPVRAGLTWRF